MDIIRHLKGFAGIMPIMIFVNIMASCSDLDTPDCREESGMTSIKFGHVPAGTKALNPDEMLISDINVFVFNCYGILEEKAFLNGLHAGSGWTWDVRLLKNAGYSIYACANFGYELDIETLEDLKNLRYYIAYPDDYSIGMPMSGCLENIVITSDEITVPMERLMAKISIRIDRSRLDDDVEFNVRSLKVERCPRSVTPFGRSRIGDPFDFFPSGFMRKDYETDALNLKYDDGKSGEVSLYMLENMQGDLLPGNDDESLKVLPENDGTQALCSYIEIKSEYMSDTGHTKPGEYLVYRFYPGDNPGNFDISRNSEYRILITPKGTGLGGTEWRIDKSGMEFNDMTLDLSYTTLNLNYIGETATITPYIAPASLQGSRLYWDSDEKSVATVTSDGTVTARGEGTCRIICYSPDGGGCSAECTVTVKITPNYMKIFPGNFIRCRKGDIIEIQCNFFPQDAPFDIGIEELEYDKSRGIYDYALGGDGKSVTLYTKERGSGLLYMEAGYPVNQAELVVIVID